MLHDLFIRSFRDFFVTLTADEYLRLYYIEQGIN